MSDFAPMLAGNAPKDLTTLRYPLMLSPKLDGIRCIVRDGWALSRNLIPLPNRQVQALFGHARFNGFDGELIVGDPREHGAYNRTQSIVMSDEGTPTAKHPLVFYVFDDVTNEFDSFLKRHAGLSSRIAKASKVIQIVPHNYCVNHQSLLVMDEFNIDAGFEGTMLRDPEGPYKHGRSTTNQGWLLKLKRFEHGEATIEGFNELRRNENEERVGGVANRRSTKAADMKAGGVLGSFAVCDLKTKKKFNVGTGISAAERLLFWQQRDLLLGKVLRYKHVPYGVKTLPRNPVFAGFRSKIDL